jgi:hypothetical protein
MHRTDRADLRRPAPTSDLEDFRLLPGATGLRCCARRQVYTRHGGAFEQYGQPVGTPRQPGDTLDDCVARCLRTRDCTFLSFGGTGHCALCSFCELHHSFDARNYTSFGRRTSGSSLGFVEVALASLPADLQQEYSTRLYGAPGRVDEASLRLLWLDLLPPRAMRSLAASGGVCKGSSAPPWRPFYAAQDVTANPRDALWVHPPLQAPRTTAIASHSFAEVTHCAQNMLHRRGAAWKAVPMWLYVAPGSGVWVNVGRTLALESFAEAAHVLARAFPGEPSDHAAALGGASCALPAATLQPAANGTGRGINWRDAGSTRALQRRTRRALIALDAVDVRALDSVQILRHQEYFSAERRHELVWLRRPECAPLRAEDQEVRCGRTPWLQRCTPQQLARVTTCVTWRTPFSTPVRQALGTPRRCRNTSCFRDQSGTYHC